MISAIHKLIQSSNSYGYVKAIDIVHEKAHDEKLFTGSFLDTKGSTTESLFVLSTTASSKSAHVTATISATDKGQASLLRNIVLSSTAGGTGTAVSLANHHLGSTESSSCLAYKNPIIATTTPIVLLESAQLGSGDGPFTVGGEAAQRNEWIVPPGETIGFRFAPDNNDTDLSWIVTFYEV